ncbi:TetR family transcriptional regulator [Spiractinospora alimapuensis]|uniref:acyl-CoA-like ligand-binding transcription factor n=1 Tax=Spiractinospora alimapuensis TaxID=2820884 RepID=UPI001F24A6D1|nr:TetR family transcriptional regulator [Spiractinospora alimapuensis]QVQ50874.1 TetR family transcriptional regulator [Spiractinospora alimapuensis]
MVERGGLRERKRHKTMRHIRDVAFDLFEEHGFDAVTVERVADAAEVSPSSIYRYFQTKEGIVLWNPNRDSALVSLFLESDDGRPLLEAVRRALTNYFASDDDWSEGPERRRLHLLLTEPAIKAAAVSRAAEAVDTLSARLAARGGAAATDFRVQVTTGALLGAVLSAVRVWHAEGGTEPLPELLDRTLAALQEGLDLT